MRIIWSKGKRALSDEQYVASLYYNLLGRAPDPEGLAAHLKFLRKGGDASRVYETFVASEEYRERQRVVDRRADEEVVPAARLDAEGFTLDMVLEASRTHFSDRPFIKSLENVPSLVGRKKRQIRTIAVYYHKMRSGGIERVTAWQVTAWTRLGYRVVLMTDEPAHPDDYPYDPTVERRVIPAKFMWSDHGEFVERGSALATVLQDTDADVFVTNLGHEICTVWDILAAKSLGIPVILGWHNVFDADYHDGGGLDAGQIRLLGHRYADLTTVLTSMDRLWFTLNGYATRIVPNPPTFMELPDESSPLTGKAIVWVARVERHQKRVDHAIQMMALVLAEHPDATLQIVGTGPDMIQARDLARSLGISSRVRFTGYTTDVARHLRQASLHLMTSEFEGFGLAIEEAWSYGVPSVMYDLSYLELVKQGKGHVAVPQGDVRALSEAVCALLADDQERNRLGAEARTVAAAYKSRSFVADWKSIFDDLAVAERLGPSLEELGLPADARSLVGQLSDKLFPPIRTPLTLPVVRPSPLPSVKRTRIVKEKLAKARSHLPKAGFKPLRMIDCTAIPLGDSFMFFSGLHALLENELAVIASDCVLHVHAPLAAVCRALFSEFGLQIAEGPPPRVEHPFFYPHPPVTNDDWRNTYFGSDWRMDWVEATDRQKIIPRPHARDTVRKLAQLFVSERLIYGRTSWKTATPSYIGFRVWYPIALKLGVYPVVFYSMVSRSLGTIREKLHGYVDRQIAADQQAGREPFRGNAAFPTGNSYQTIDPETYKHIMDAVGADAFTCFVQDDSAWREDFLLAGVETRHLPTIDDALKTIRTAANVVTCCSFTSHVAQFLRDDFVLVMFKDLPENNVNPGANPKVLTYNPPCSPCNYLPRGQSKTCPAGYPHCIALDSAPFRNKIIDELKGLLARDRPLVLTEF